MAQLGVLCLPGRGHLYPATALARALGERGHKAVIFSSKIARALVGAEGVQFCGIEGAGSKSGFRKKDAEALIPGRYDTRKTVGWNARELLDHGKELINSYKLDGLLIDQADLAGSSIAQALQLPFVTMSFFPPLYLSADVPPVFCHWKPGDREYNTVNIERANALLSRLARPITEMVNSYRSRWSLAPLGNLNEFFSPLGIISQLPQELDFPRELYGVIHYANMFRRRGDRHALEFPWEAVGQGPLIYASLGTVRNYSKDTFELIANACQGTGVPLILSLGGMELLPDGLTKRWENTLIVHYAPQLELLKRASVVICHGGLNTVLESVSAGVPMLILPFADDQAGVGARIAWKGLGTMILRKDLSAKRLRCALFELLTDRRYRTAAEAMRDKLSVKQGTALAIELIERLLGCKP